MSRVKWYTFVKEYTRRKIQTVYDLLNSISVSKISSFHGVISPSAFFSVIDVKMSSSSERAGRSRHAFVHVESSFAQSTFISRLASACEC